jgi:hypothetical protein
MKPCKGCGKHFAARPNEKPGRYAARIYCSRACSDPARKGWKQQDGLTRFEAAYIPEPNSGCWLWLGPQTRGGYGAIRVDHVGFRAHRYSFQIHKGPIPDGLIVRHQCDTPECVNPDHLHLGTIADNAADAVARNRMPRGERCVRAKLTESAVASIRADRRVYTAIAAEHGVSPALVCLIKQGKLWSHSHER